VANLQAEILRFAQDDIGFLFGLLVRREDRALRNDFVVLLR
jgi:hypothetical protein